MHNHPRLISLITILLVAQLVISSCTVLGPDYEEPKVDWLEDWRSTVYPTAESKLQEQAKSIEDQLINAVNVPGEDLDKV